MPENTAHPNDPESKMFSKGLTLPNLQSKTQRYLVYSDINQRKVASPHIGEAGTTGWRAFFHDFAWKMANNNETMIKIVIFLSIHYTSNCFTSKPNCWTNWNFVQMLAVYKSQGITKVFRIHALETMNVGTKIHGNPPPYCLRYFNLNPFTPLFFSHYRHVWSVWVLLKYYIMALSGLFLHAVQSDRSRLKTPSFLCATYSEKSLPLALGDAELSRCEEEEPLRSNRVDQIILTALNSFTATQLCGRTRRELNYRLKPSLASGESLTWRGHKHTSATAPAHEEGTCPQYEYTR